MTNRSFLEGLNPEWDTLLQSWVDSAECSRLCEFLESEKQKGLTWAPEERRFLRALQGLRPSDIRVVILGQDPYPTPGHATGLAFGLENGAGPLPRSLKNIYKEISVEYQLDLQDLVKKGSDLVGWAQQGVLLLNTVLSVRVGPEQAGSHRGKGWESLTDLILKSLDQRSEPICFILWGKPAQEKKKWIQGSHHLVLEAAHPSPLSANRGFFGCNHFRLANEFLEKKLGRPGVDWARVTG